MGQRLAECPLFQWFCGIDALDGVRVPGKSALQQYAHWLDEGEMRKLIEGLLRSATGLGEDPPLGLAESVEVGTIWLDATCVDANMHFPVDWVLLRDGVRTLMKAVALIRRHGLRHRMPEPGMFLSKINRLCMEMSAVRRQSDSRRERKRVLRAMKKLARVVATHAHRYRQLLDAQWERTDWTRKQAEGVLRRMDRMLELLPRAVKQAHERIIGERQVLNRQKLLSLYETEVRVIVRGKAGAEVEFGNQLLLAEQKDGVIVDWLLEREKVSANPQMLEPCLQRIRQALPHARLRGLGTDRGFSSRDNHLLLKQARLFDGICPKDPAHLKRRLKVVRFIQIQKRRAQTEARIAIFKNVFAGKPMRAKGFVNRQLAVSWCVLAHNLWVLARLPEKKEYWKLKKAA